MYPFDLRHSMARFKESAVVFDLDGVLCNNSAELDLFIRLNEPSESHEDWREWYATLHTYDSHPEYVALARMISDAGHKIIILTARPKYLHNMTSSWLEVQLPFGYHRLSMWDHESVRWRDAKTAAIAELIDEFNVRLAFDDSTHWVNLFREHGVPTIFVNRKLISVSLDT
jgi:phosphoserine phosphatase